MTTTDSCTSPLAASKVGNIRRVLLLSGVLALAPAVSGAPAAVALTGAVIGTAIAAVALLAPPRALASTTIPEWCAHGFLTYLVTLGAASVVLAVPRLLHESNTDEMSTGLLLAGLTFATFFFARHANRLLGVLLAVALTADLAVTVHRMPVIIDVLVFEREGSSALLKGINPYAITYSNPFPPRFDHLYFGPGIASDGVIHVGFPYPPLSLLACSVGYLLGDVRYATCLAMAFACLVLWRGSSDRLSRASAAVLLGIPGLPGVLGAGWTEPIVIGLLAGCVVAMNSGWRVAPYLLGALLVSKQYLLFASPLVFLLFPIARQTPGGIGRFALKTTASCVLFTVPAIVWSPAAFWDSLVAFQFRQPFRPDSVSALVALVNATGWPPTWTYGLIPLAASSLTALALAARAPRTPASFAACLAVTLAVMFLTSKQAFANYYFLSLGALLVAVSAWPTRPHDSAHVVSENFEEPPSKVVPSAPGVPQGRRPTSTSHPQDRAEPALYWAKDSFQSP